MDLSIKLGSSISDRLTKRVGVVYGVAEYTYCEKQYLVLFAGETKEEWIGAGQVTLAALAA